MKKLSDKKPAICCNIKLDYRDSKNNTIDYKAVRATCSKCGKIYEQNLSTNAVYASEGKQFIHLGCGEEVDCIWVHHPIWDGPFECSGSGSVDKYPVPYCPKHETRPTDNGIPIRG